jgi:two-component system cell cycle sensor histidine kinase/response regulator CckA
MVQGTGGERRVVAQLLDITAGVWAKEKYRTLVQSAPVGILSFDAEGRIQELNPKMLEILGFPCGEAARGINLLSFPLLIQAGIVDNFRRCVRSGEASIVESAHTSAWGRKTYLRYHLTPLKREQERVVEVQAVVEDITEQKRLESCVLRSQEMEALDTLSGGFVHEFNNLLQVIQGYGELLSLETGKPPQRQQAVREIQLASRRAAELTRQLLAFGSKLESELEPLDLNREVRRTMQLLRAGVLKNVEVELQLGESLRPILADSAQLQQVLTNLAINSVKAMTQRVRIRTAEADNRCCSAAGGLQPSPYQHLAFAHDGEGIGDTAVKSIFDPGSGLGLSVVYSIVRNHGGHIECRSHRGEGTIFDIFLPAVPSCLEEQKPQAHFQMRPAAQPVAELGRRILLVDDEQTLCKLGREYLNSCGYEVSVAGDCEEALALFQKQPVVIDLVILDLILPGRSGEWCLEQILRLKPEQKVLVTSGYSVTATVSAMLRAGASGFINKPYHLAELLAIVRDILGVTA